MHSFLCSPQTFGSSSASSILNCSMESSSEIAVCFSKLGEKVADKDAAVEALSKIADFTKQASAAPFVVKNFPTLLTTTANKEKTVAAAACAAVEAVIANLSKYAVALVVPLLIASLGTKKKPEEKICALNSLTSLAVSCPQEVSWCLVEALPPALDLLTDIKKNVQTAALDTCA